MNYYKKLLLSTIKSIAFKTPEKERYYRSANMEVKKMTSNTTSSENNKRVDHEEVMLPGFRFHPTDEELVGFYLRRKVEKKPISIELIKQIDIYKYDPWDLPKVSTVGDKEWYFFCIRGRKYRNSIRPNRVTGSGFWKATGIDKPIYSVKEAQHHECIGLKKSLVYYRGSAGKGTKTDWMMHEFRLPPNGIPTTFPNPKETTTTAQQLEAEVWTICRIFKRTPSYKKYVPDWRESTIGTISPTNSSSTKTCSLESDYSEAPHRSFEESVLQRIERKPATIEHVDDEQSRWFVGQFNPIVQAPFAASYHPAGVWNPNGGDNFFSNGNWDELGPVVQLAIDPSQLYDCR